MTTPTRPAHATAWRNAVFAIFALNGLGAATWAIRIPSIRDHLELSTSFVGYLILGVSVGSIIGLLLASHVIQWLGGRPQHHRDAHHLLVRARRDRARHLVARLVRRRRAGHGRLRGSAAPSATSP